MANTVTISENVVEAILSSLRDLQRELTSLREEIRSTPPYGSAVWWRKAIKEAREDVREGRYYKPKDMKDLLRYLHS